MFKTRCKEVDIQFRTVANRPAQRVRTNDCGACDWLILERLGDTLIIHFTRTVVDKNNVSRNIIIKNLFWPIDVVSEWMCEGVDSFEYREQQPDKRGLV